MSVRPTLLKDICRTAIGIHQQASGKGNYNRFASIAPRDRSFSTGKRPHPQDIPDPPRLDANTVFAQLKNQEVTMLEAKTLLKKAAETGEECLRRSHWLHHLLPAPGNGHPAHLPQELILCHSGLHQACGGLPPLQALWVPIPLVLGKKTPTPMLQVSSLTGKNPPLPRRLQKKR